MTVQLNIFDDSKAPLKWRDLLLDELKSEYYLKLKNFIKTERTNGKIIYPAEDDVFRAIKHTPFDRVKVVILGQDPYHGPGQAHGLCFSVPKNIPPPPSLKNIFLELKNDCGIKAPNHGNLSSWAEQGVLLLNSVLTVEANKPASHANLGWERFTDKIISLINDHSCGTVFMLWGSYAHKKGMIISSERHHILKAPHPSPLSAHRGFLGCKHFSQANELLRLQGKSPIDWQI